MTQPTQLAQPSIASTPGCFDSVRLEALKLAIRVYEADKYEASKEDIVRLMEFLKDKE